MGRRGLPRAVPLAAVSAVTVIAAIAAGLAAFLATGLVVTRVVAPHLADPDQLVQVVEAQHPGGLDEDDTGPSESELVVHTAWTPGTSPECPAESTSTWSVREQRYQTVILTRCTLARTAFALLNAEVAARSAVPGDASWEAWHYETAETVVRLWVEDSALVRVETACALTRDCDFWSRSLVFDLVNDLPTGRIATSPLTSYLATPGMRIWFGLGLLLLALGAVRAGGLLRQERLPATPTRPGWADLTAVTDRIGWLLRLRTAGTITALLALPAVGVLIIADLLSEDPSSGALLGAVLIGAQAVALAALALWANRVVRRELRRGESPAPAPRGSTFRAALGTTLDVTGRWVQAIGWLAALALLTLLIVLGGGSPAPALWAVAAGGPTWAAVRELLLGVVGGFGAILSSSNGHLQVWAVGLAAIGLLAPFQLAGLALIRLGRRLLVPSIAQARAADQRPPLLLLRSFDEDRSDVLSLVPPRSAVPAWLRLRRGRRFEEVLAATLADHGPLIAIAPPGGILPSIGAAKESLSHGQWQARVDELTTQAGIVVFLATPESVNAGLAWELANSGRHLGPDRLLLVLGPYRSAEVARRWAGFAAAASALNPALAGLASLQLSPGAQAIAWDGAQWVQVGARRRNDVTYKLCLDEALRLQAWARSPLRG